MKVVTRFIEIHYEMSRTQIFLCFISINTELPNFIFHLPVHAVCGNFAILGMSSGHIEVFNIQSGIHRGEIGRPKGRNDKKKIDV